MVGQPQGVPIPPPEFGPPPYEPPSQPGFVPPHMPTDGSGPYVPPGECCRRLGDAMGGGEQQQRVCPGALEGGETHEGVGAAIWSLKQGSLGWGGGHNACSRAGPKSLFQGWCCSRVGLSPIRIWPLLPCVKVLICASHSQQDITRPQALTLPWATTLHPAPTPLLVATRPQCLSHPELPPQSQCCRERSSRVPPCRRCVPTASKPSPPRSPTRLGS